MARTATSLAGGKSRARFVKCLVVALRDKSDCCLERSLSGDSGHCHHVRDEGVAGSNPATPTNFPVDFESFFKNSLQPYFPPPPKPPLKRLCRRRSASLRGSVTSSSTRMRFSAHTTAYGSMAPSSAGPGKPQQHENRSETTTIGENPSSTERWKDVPRGTMDEVSSFVRLDLPSI